MLLTAIPTQLPETPQSSGNLTPQSGSASSSHTPLWATKHENKDDSPAGPSQSEPPEEKDSPVTTELKSMCHSWVQCINDRDFSAMAPHVSPDFKMQCPWIARTMSFTEYAALLKEMQAAGSKYHVDVVDVVASVNELKGYAIIYVSILGKYLAGTGDTNRNGMKVMRWKVRQGRWQLYNVVGISGNNAG